METELHWLDTIWVMDCGLFFILFFLVNNTSQMFLPTTGFYYYLSIHFINLRYMQKDNDLKHISRLCQNSLKSEEKKTSWN